MSDVFHEEEDDRGTMEWYRRQIDQLLDEDRPNRAGSGDKDWRERTYGWARTHIPNEDNLVRDFAKDQVDRREGLATKRGNNFLREWWNGQRPLAWSLCGPLPIRIGQLRVRLDAATPDDIDDAAEQLHSEALKTFNRVVELTQGMRDLGHQARTQGYGQLSLLGDLPPHGEEDQAQAA